MTAHLVDVSAIDSIWAVLWGLENGQYFGLAIEIAAIPVPWLRTPGIARESPGVLWFAWETIEGGIGRETRADSKEVSRRLVRQAGRPCAYASIHCAQIRDRFFFSACQLVRPGRTACGLPCLAERIVKAGEDVCATIETAPSRSVRHRLAPASA